MYIYFSDSYVKSKLGSLAWIPAKDRCKLCDEAIQYEGNEVSAWISVSRGESEWPKGFVEFGPVTEDLRDFLNQTLVNEKRLLKNPLRVIYVCGLDHFNKCSYVQTMAKQKNIGFAVVYRSGYDETEIRDLTKPPGAIYIPLTGERGPLSNVSSTEIRKFFENSSNNSGAITQFIYPNVREYMARKYRK